MYYLKINRIIFWGALALIFVLSGCSKTHETRLGNGLKVVVKEDHRSPVVVSQIWYKIGGIDEPKGITGVSHVLEHMMFKGTKKYPSGEFSRIIAENGGRENAFTSRDYTAYFQTLEKSRLPIAFELEADRMTNLVLEEKEFSKEIKVVMEERRLRTEDKPEGKLYEKFSATAYTKHPYGNPIIGWMEDLQSLTIKDVHKWYKRWYAPNNATCTSGTSAGMPRTMRHWLLWVMSIQKRYLSWHESILAPFRRRRLHRFHCPKNQNRTASVKWL